MRGVWLAGVLGAAGITATACRSPAFACTDDAQCGSGVCQGSGYCSFPDARCDSGQRYGEHAATALAGSCVDAGPGDDAASATTGDRPSSTETLGGTGEVGEDTASTAGATAAEATGTGTEGAGTTSDSDGSDEGPATTCPGFFDDFDDGVVGDAWALSHPQFITEMDGELQILVDRPAGPFISVLLTDPHDLSQGWFRAELGETPDSSATQQDVEVFDADDLSQSVALLVEGDVLIARHRPPGGGFENVAVMPFDADAHAWLQLRGDGDTVHFETSQDGVDFESFAAYDCPFTLANVRVGLRANNYMALPADDILSYRQVVVCSEP